MTKHVETQPQSRQAKKSMEIMIRANPGEEKQFVHALLFAMSMSGFDTD